MENKQYLNEEKYQKNKNKLIKLVFAVLILGLLIVGGIVAGIKKYNDIKVESEQSKVDKEQNMVNRKQELTTKIVAEEAKLLARKKS